MVEGANLTASSDGKPGLVVAFPGGRGTAHMIRTAQEAGVLVVVLQVQDDQAEGIH